VDRMPRPATRTDELVLAAIFGAAILYCLYGAFTGDLWFPGRRGPGVHLRGEAAWLATVAPVSIYAGLLVRIGRIPIRGDRLALAAEIALIALGVGLLYGGARLAGSS